jgi:hypothetical protein
MSGRRLISFPISVVPGRRNLTETGSVHYAFAGLGDELVDNALETARAGECRELPVGARPVLENAVDVLDLGARAELIDDVVDEPLDEL